MDNYICTFIYYRFSPVVIRSRTIEIKHGRYCCTGNPNKHTLMYIAHQYTIRNHKPTAIPQPSSHHHITKTGAFPSTHRQQNPHHKCAITTTIFNHACTRRLVFTPLRLFLSSQVHFSQPPLLPSQLPLPVSSRPPGHSHNRDHLLIPDLLIVGAGGYKERKKKWFRTFKGVVLRFQARA